MRHHKDRSKERQRWRKLAPVAAIALAVTLGCTTLSHDWLAFVSGRSLFEHRSQSVVSRCAREPILRRDPMVFDKMKRYYANQAKLDKRQGGPDLEKMKAKLFALGLQKKWEEMEAKRSREIWHLNHIVPGDAFLGVMSHPRIRGGTSQQVQIIFESPQDGTWKIGSEEGKFTYKQDFPIKSPEDKAAYVFNKFNKQWRALDQPMPTASDVEYMPLETARFYFNMVASTENYPTEEQYQAAVANPEKGFTPEEFVAWLDNEQPGYIDSNWDLYYTGRRIVMEDDSLRFYGDFQDEGGRIYGFTEFEGTDAEGTFNIKLAKKQ